MPRPRRSSLIWRLAQLALMPAAALAVHQLRYWPAGRGESPRWVVLTAGLPRPIGAVTT